MSAIFIWGDQKSCREHIDPRRIAELLKNLLAVFPRQAKRADVGDPKPSYHSSQQLGILRIEDAFLYGMLGPCDKIAERLLVPEVGGELVGNGPNRRRGDPSSLRYAATSRAAPPWDAPSGWRNCLSHRLTKG